MNILVFGAGAVGLGLASFIIQAKQNVFLIGKKETVDELKKNGLQRVGIFGEYHALPDKFFVTDNLKNLPQKNFDYVLVCTKSFDSSNSAEIISSFLKDSKKESIVILCQNGWGNAETFSQFISKHQIKNARVITGFRRLLNNKVEITVHADAIKMGNLFGENVMDLHPLRDVLNEGGMPCDVTETIERDLWAKMLYNCMLNGLSTLFNVPYGKLGESVFTRNLMDKIALEVFVVMRAAGFRTHWDCVEDYIKVFYQNQLPATYHHEPSMLQDIRSLKRTEIDTLNGAVIALGKKHNLETPHNFFISSAIHFLENQSKKY